MSLPPILNRALNAAYEGANEIIQFSKRIDNLKIIKKGTNDFSNNLDQYHGALETLETEPIQFKAT